MGDAFSCTALQYGWIPLTALSLLIVLLLILKYKKEGDYIKKEKIAGNIKYPAMLFIASLILIPVLDSIVKNDYLSLGCKGGPILGPSSCSVIKEFADGTNRRMIKFPNKGSFDSETKIKIPRDATVKKAEIKITHPQTGAWNANFSFWNSVGESSGIDIDSGKGYAYMKMKKVEISTPVTWEGTQVFDDLHIKRGGMITTPLGKTLELRITGTLTIDEGAGINVDGKGDVKPDRQSKKEEAGNMFGSGGGAGGYGGRGGKGGDDLPMVGGSGGVPYGSIENPEEMGSAGANGGGAQGTAGGGLPGTGGRGGGAIAITANEAVINGYVSANGLNAPDAPADEGTGGGGGGSGGSVRISADNVIIRGRVTANGGNGGSDPGDDGGGGGGGGGRVLIAADIINGDAIYADGGRGGRASAGKAGRDGERGTVKLTKKPKALESSMIKSYITSVAIRPDNLRCWGVFKAKAEMPSGSEIAYSIINASNNQTLCNIKPAEAAAGYDISSCTSCEQGIRLRTDMVTINVAKSPLIYNWGVGYETEIKKLGMDIGMDRTGEYAKASFYGNTTVSDENTQPKISGELTRLSTECMCKGCVISADACTIAIDFSSESSGSLILEDPNIEYCTAG